MHILIITILGFGLVFPCGEAQATGLNQTPLIGKPLPLSAAPTTGSIFQSDPSSGICAIRPGQRNCTITLKWNMPTNVGGCIFVRSGNQLFACVDPGQSGSQKAPWIGMEDTYFDLRPSSNPNDRVIASTMVKGIPIDFGVIRFDAWSANSEIPEMNNLEQVGYKFFGRMPFFTQLNSDLTFHVSSNKQQVADNEIDLALSRGFKYFAFNYARFTTIDYKTGQLPNNSDSIANPYLKFNYKQSTSLDLYLSSSRSAKPKFTLIIGVDILKAYINDWRPRDVSRDRAWQNVLDDLKRYLTNPLVYKTPDGRPMLYLLGTEWDQIWDGDINLARSKLNELRSVVASTKGSLFITMMSGYPDRLQNAVKQLGIDSTTTYAHNAGTSSTGKGSEKPYSDISKGADWYLETLSGRSSSYRVDTIPNVTTGWDYRPLLDYGNFSRTPEGNWFKPATPDEVIGQVDKAVNFIVSNPDQSSSKNILFYAWNELEEGGLLVPTLESGSKYIDAIARYQGINVAGTGVPSVEPAKRPIVSKFGTGCSDGYGVWMIGYNFGSHAAVQVRARGGSGPEADKIIETIYDPSRGTDANGYQTLSFCLTNRVSRSYFSGEGLDLTIVHPDVKSVSTPIGIKFAASQPEPAQAPLIEMAGTGCNDGYGIWIVGNHFTPNSVVKISDASIPDRPLITIYESPTRSTYQGSDALSFCFSGQAERNALASAGIQAAVSNPNDGTTSNWVFLKKP